MKTNILHEGFGRESSHLRARALSFVGVEWANLSPLMALTTMTVAVAEEHQVLPENQHNLNPLIIKAKRDRGYKTDAVSSAKYLGALLDTPKTVSVVPAEVIVEQGAKNLTEILRNIPGIAIQAGESGGASNTAGDMFSLRGFDASASLFRDGLRDTGLMSRDAFNTESVEVFPGPSGADVGRATAAGYVNVVSKFPQQEEEGTMTQEIGSGARWRQAFDYNARFTALGAPEFFAGSALRLNLMTDRQDALERDRVQREAWGVASAVKLDLKEHGQLTILQQHMQQNNVPDYGAPLINGRPIAGSSRDWFYGSTRANHEDVEQDSLGVIHETNLTPRMSLRQQTRVAEARRDAVITNPGYSTTTKLVTRSLQANLRNNDSFAYQAMAMFNSEKDAWQIGLTAVLDFSLESQDSQTGSATLSSLSPLLRPTDFNASRPVATTHSSGEAQTWGLSLIEQVKWSERWIFDAALRWDRYDVRYNARSPVSATNPDGKVDADLMDLVSSGKVGLTFKPAREGSIYVAYGSSITPPGMSNFALSESITSQDNPNLEPQESFSYELGSKWDFLGDALNLNAAIFHTQNTNVLYSDDSTGLYQQDGGQLVEGLTCGVSGKLSEDWSIFANGTWLDAQLDQPGDQYDGHRIIRTPEFSGSLWSTYRVNDTWTIGLGWRYQSSTDANAANTIEVPAYALVDAMLEYRWSASVSSRLNLRNLFDREYISSINNSGQRFNYGEPLNVMLSTSYSF